MSSPKSSHHAGDGHDHSEAKATGDPHAHGGVFGSNTEVIFAVSSGVALALGFGLERLAPGVPAWLPLCLYLVAYGFGGFFTFREAFENLRNKRFEIDTLMLVAAAGAAALGAWAEGALLLFLFSIGHALEHYAMGRAKRAIEALADLAPRTAHVRRGDEVVEVPVEEVEVGDTIVVRPNERLPADGFVVVGATSINQAPVTGESMPVDKQPVTDAEAARARPAQIASASIVFAGTLNGSGSIEIEATRKSTDTTRAKVVRMVSEAETQKSPTQQFTDRFERIFVPVVLGLAFSWGAFLGWTAVFGELALAPVALYLAAILWTIGYDTIYAHQDRRDDAIVGVRSTARLFGRYTKLSIGGLFVATVVALAVAFALVGAGWPAYVGLAAFAVHLAWQVITLDEDDPARCLMLFRSNRIAGWLPFLGLVADAALRSAGFGA